MPFARCFNPKCPHGGSCRKFHPKPDQNIPVDAGLDDAYYARILLGLICLCGCYGTQHWDEETSPSSVPQPVPSQSLDHSAKQNTQPTHYFSKADVAGWTSQPGAKMADESTASGSSLPPTKFGVGSTATFDSQPPLKFNAFADSARLRKQRQQSVLKDEIEQKAFDPASQIHQQAWSKLSSRPEKRKKNHSEKGSKGPAMQKLSSKKSKAEKPYRFSLVLIAKTSKVDNDVCVLPEAQEMDSLYRAGNIVPFAVTDSITPEQIDEKVKDAFSKHPSVHHGSVSMHRWRLLSKVKRGQGKRSSLKDVKVGGEVQYHDLMWNAETHRQVPRYKKIIFIALPMCSDDILLDVDSDESEEAHDDDEGLDDEARTESSVSDVVDDMKEESVQEAGDMGIGAGMGNSDFAGENDYMGVDDGFNAGATNMGTSFENNPGLDYSTVIPDLFRLSVNITHHPSRRAHVTWWNPGPKVPFIELQQALDTLMPRLDIAESSVPHTAAAIAVMLLDEAGAGVFRRLEFMTQLAQLQITSVNPIASQAFAVAFTSHFRLGPHGFHPLIDFFNRLLNIFVINRDEFNEADLSVNLGILNTYAAPLFSLVLHFRSTVNRAEFDPPGFADLRHELRTGRDKFGEADEDDQLMVISISITRDSLEDVKMAVHTDFGTMTDLSEMRTESLLVGSLGLDGFIERVIDPLLDTLPMTHPNYVPFMQFFGTFCQLLARKMKNHKKSAGKQRKDGNASSSHTTGQEDPSEMAGGNSQRRRGSYKLRSKSESSQAEKMGFTSDHDDPLFLSDTDSSVGTMQDYLERLRAESKRSPSFFEFNPTEEERARFERPQGSSPQNDYESDFQGSHISEDMTTEAETETTNGTRSDSEYVAGSPPSPPQTTFSRRPPFPYPNTGPKGERTNPRQTPCASGSSSRPAASPPRPQPRPRPRRRAPRAWNATTDVVHRPEELEGIYNQQTLLRTILESFPHPIIHRRRTWAQITRYPELTRWRQVALIYHTDKNAQVTEPGWQHVCDSIIKVITSRFGS